MSTNELNLIANQKTNLPIGKILGVVEIVGAPMLLLQFLIGGIEQNSSSPNNSSLVSALGVLYIGGWIGGAIGMFRQKIYGETTAAKIVFTLQIISLTLAFLFSIQETLGVSYESGGKFFFVCDMGYPASHLFMIVVGVFVLRAKRLKNFTRFAPFLVGAALPVTMLLGGFVGMIAGVCLFGGLTTAGLGMIGYSVYSNRQQIII